MLCHISCLSFYVILFIYVIFVCLSRHVCLDLVLERWQSFLFLISNGSCAFLHSCTHRTAESISFNMSVLNTACYIPNGSTIVASQSAPAVWTRVKERPQVTRDGNSRVVKLNAPTFTLLELTSLGGIVWQSVHRRWTGSTA